MRAYPTAVPAVLTSAQREAVEHAGGPLLVLGGAGSGKTTAAVERFAHLAERDGGPESVLALTLGDGEADRLRERIEDRLAVAYEELSVTTFPELCARLLRDEALEAGIDPFATPVGAADRLAMLLEHIDDAPAAPPRPARQPERDARRDRRPDRPPQGRADLRRGLPGRGPTR